MREADGAGRRRAHGRAVEPGGQQVRHFVGVGVDAEPAAQPATPTGATAQ